MWKQENAVYAEDGKTVDRRITTSGRTAPAESVIAFVGKGVAFKGVITYSGTVRIDGAFDGEIHADGGLVVGPEAVITAKITAGSVVSEGTITGDVYASERVTLLSPAVMNGSLKTPLLSIEEGVRMNGTLEMAESAPRNVPRESKLYPVGSSARTSGKREEEKPAEEPA
ncbi:MAG: polymer-forming cytoskeletal protein [Nitrospira sp.]|nr:polymer-forming cytoskeletal protein [Nitrospira sp.]MCP9463923.1 polymer-forming cytoskeletal protein [Nitrospira sp.]